MVYKDTLPTTGDDWLVFVFLAMHDERNAAIDRFTVDADQLQSLRDDTVVSVRCVVRDRHAGVPISGFLTQRMDAPSSSK